MSEYRDCSEVLNELDLFLDRETGKVDYDELLVHLNECAPCLDEHHVQRVLRAVVARACAGESCSDEVRARVVAHLRTMTSEVNQP